MGVARPAADGLKATTPYVARVKLRRCRRRPGSSSKSNVRERLPDVITHDEAGTSVSLDQATAAGSGEQFR